MDGTRPYPAKPEGVSIPDWEAHLRVLRALGLKYGHKGGIAVAKKRTKAERVRIARNAGRKGGPAMKKKWERIRAERAARATGGSVGGR